MANRIGCWQQWWAPHPEQRLWTTGAWQPSLGRVGGVAEALHLPVQALVFDIVLVSSHNEECCLWWQRASVRAPQHTGRNPGRQRL